MGLERVPPQRESGGWAASLSSSPCARCPAEPCQCVFGANPLAWSPTSGHLPQAHRGGLLCARHYGKRFVFMILLNRFNSSYAWHRVGT